LAECGSAPDESTYATLSLTTIRDARRNWTAENHLYNLVHRGYASEPGGHARCPFEFYRNWVNDPAGVKEQVESLTRDADSPERAATARMPSPPKAPRIKTPAPAETLMAAES
jgi:amidase